MMLSVEETKRKRNSNYNHHVDKRVKSAKHKDNLIGQIGNCVRVQH